jgi:hypothetical protein
MLTFVLLFHLSQALVYIARIDFDLSLIDGLIRDLLHAIP